MNLVQVLINGLITSAELAIIAIGLTMTFSVLRFANFAHTETAVVGAYLALLFNVTFGWNASKSTLRTLPAIRRVPSTEVSSALAPHLAAEVDAANLLDAHGYFRTSPASQRTDGFFAALLEKR